MEAVLLLDGRIISVSLIEKHETNSMGAKKAVPTRNGFMEI
jgi:hypothetical protein